VTLSRYSGQSTFSFIMKISQRCYLPHVVQLMNNNCIVDVCSGLLLRFNFGTFLHYLVKLTYFQMSTEVVKTATVAQSAKLMMTVESYHKLIVCDFL
jgi:hypothetical protein